MLAGDGYIGATTAFGMQAVCKAARIHLRCYVFQFMEMSGFNRL
jgi:hypothetical protein